MVSFNPEKRPLIDEILKSEWLEELNGLKEESMIDIENQVREELIKREFDIRKNYEKRQLEEDSAFR